MTLQEPVLRSVTIGVDWPLPPRLPEVRGELTELLRRLLETEDDWFWAGDEDGPNVHVWNDEQRLHAMASARGVFVVTEKPDEEAARAVVSDFLGEASRILALPRTTACSAGATWTLATTDAREAESAIESWLCAPRLRDRLGAIGGRPDDLILSVRYLEDGQVSTLFRTEPVTDEQAVNGGFFLSDVEATEFAPASVLAVIDRRQEKEEGQPAAAVERAERHLEHVLANGAETLTGMMRADESD